MFDDAVPRDQQLATRLRAGDRTAFTEIYNQHKKSLYAHAYQRLRHEQEADDVIHDVFATLWVKRAELDVHVNLAGYLFVAVRNRILDLVARKGLEARYLSSFAAFLARDESNADFLVREGQLAGLIEQEIAQLPGKMREVFELSRTDGLSHREIAEKLNLSEKTVKAQVNNALKLLRVKLGGLVWLCFLVACGGIAQCEVARAAGAKPAAVARP